ncbi:MAG: AMP-binding protein [Chlamydiia bacterium]|nr:AMP-binding protein [Chlamydiia bacterium]
MRTLIEGLIRWTLKIALWFRYRIKVKGFDKVKKENLKRPGGILFLPNHSAMGVDPLAIATVITKKFRLRPLIVEYMYYATGVHAVMKYINAIPVPNNEVSSNSVKKIRSDKALSEVVQGLKRGENFLMYPSGRLKDTGYEFIGGASGTHRILGDNPEINIVLVRLVGLWGSSFSKAYTGYSPPLFPTLWSGIKHTFKNLLFFNPRRKLTIEFEVAPEDFPRYGSRQEINSWLEKWYDRPEGLRPKDSKVIGEPLKRVSYSLWKKEYLEPVPPKVKAVDPEINLDKIPEETKQKVIRKVAEVAGVNTKDITPITVISSDLGLDSLDMAELVLYLEEEFDVKGVPVIELTNVARMMAIAARQIVPSDEKTAPIDTRAWDTKVEKERVFVAEGETIPEVFLNNAARWGKAVAVGDDRTGVMTYERLRLGAVVLAEYIKDLPGDNIGIMLPASVGATLTTLAVQLAGKVPVMINWTVGPRHLNHVIEGAGIKRILTSWAFLDKLGNVDLADVDDELLMLEDVKREIGLGRKIRGALLSKKSPEKILEHFKIDKRTKDDTAVILFTSGTEAAPKGVPLTHGNILSNLRSVCKTVEVFSNDIYFAVLPPFHSFGLTAGVFFGTLTGMRVAFYPDPTNGPMMARGIEKWRCTVVTGAPTFLKAMLKAGEPEQFQTLRWVVSGAEKAPPELYDLMERKGMPGVLREGYGITETSPVLTLNRLDMEPGGVGMPVADVDLLIIHPETHKPLQQGEDGLVLARGPNVFKGYLNKMLKSPFLTIEGKEWYNTGDLGHIDDEGRLILSGRLKRFIKIGGEMISLGAIEHALLSIAPKYGWKLAEEGPSIAVIALEIPDQRPLIKVVSIFESNVDELNKACRESGLSNLVKITEHIHLDEIPVMGTGKINYRELENRYITSTLPLD